MDESVSPPLRPRGRDLPFSAPELANADILICGLGGAAALFLWLTRRKKRSRGVEGKRG